tara:strand:+ start:3870 stop:4406 length:537 start_codon:yes stop_codon:yes gene_type:complete
MDFSSLLKADNPYKFFFLTGAFLIVFSLYYPFEQRQEIELKKNNVDLIYTKLSIEAKYLSEEIKINKDKSFLLIQSLDSLINVKKAHPKKSKTISDIINKKKNEFNDLFDKLQLKEYNLNIKSIDAEYKKSEIDIYEKYLKRFRLFSYVIIAVGLFLFIWGGIKWFKEHKMRIEKEFA